jgi:hypothetical protein
MSYSYLVPGILIMKQGVFKTGTARQCNMGEPDFADAIGAVSVTSQAVTPAGRKRRATSFPPALGAIMATKRCVTR